MNKADFRLYLITDRRQAPGGDLFATVEGALAGGVRAVQLREKDISPRDLLELARAMRGLTDRYGAKLIINDRADIALAAGADGVHLGEAGIPADAARRVLGDGSIIGVSCHSRESALAAEKAGADFITFGPVYHTPSKAAYGAPAGLELLAEAVSLLSIPVFALGGIKRENTPDTLATGAAGIALISAIIAAENPKEEARAFLSLLAQGERTE